MSDEKKTVAMPQKKDAKKKNGKTIGWFIGIVVLILISVTFILPSTAFMGGNTSNAISFGKYDGKKIEMTYDSYFYYALQNVYQAYAQTYGEDSLMYFIYNIYYSAFQNAVVNLEFQKMAEQVGIKPTSKQITDAVVASGFFSDGANVYSAEVYAGADDMAKAQIVAWMQQSVPYEQVEDDLESIKVSKAEADFIGSLSEGERRAFDYLLVSSSIYPEADAIAYAEANPEKFSTVSFRRATVETEELAVAALEELKAGSLTFEQLVEDSIDGSASAGGVMADVYRFVIDDYLSRTESGNAAEELYTSEAGSIIGPVNTADGWTLFYIDQAAAELDSKREDLPNAVRAYLTLTEPENMRSWAESMAAEVYAEAQADWYDAADKYGIETRAVSAVAENAGDSQFIVSFNYVDVAYDEYLNAADGYVYSAVKNNPGLEEKLFAAEIGAIMEPVAVAEDGNAFIIVKPRAVPEALSSSTISIVKDLYASQSPEYSVIDYQNTILNSGKLEDDFVNGFMQAAYGI